MWQFIPSTGRIMGLRQDGWSDDRRNVLASTRAAPIIWSSSTASSAGLGLAMAAYNCGPGRIEFGAGGQSQARQTTDFWSLDLPTETEHYVPQTWPPHGWYSEPAAYLDCICPRSRRGPQLQVVRSDRPIALAELAQTTGVPLADLRRSTSA